MTVSQRRPTVPNYDLPNAAPEPLRQVQLFVNSIDREHDREWLPAWLEEHGLSASDYDRAVALREALRALLRVNNEGGAAPEARAQVSEAARDVRVELDDDGVVLTGADALAEVTAIALSSMLDGTWGRLKVCRNCEWSFYDTSKNRSGSWCSMQLCGNRLKTRAYRSRRKGAAA
jgi:predicted RNA-binding Zn ribbon-like protein